METIKASLNKKKLSVEVDKNDFALSLKTWRLRNGYTQTEVAKMFECSRYTIIRAEKGKNITWEMAYRLFARLSYQLEKEDK